MMNMEIFEYSIRLYTNLVKFKLHLAQCLLDPMQPLISDGIGLEAFASLVSSLTLLLLLLLRLVS